MTRIRIQRLEKELLKLISTVVNYKLRDQRLDLVTINYVRLSNDMSHAKIYYSFLEEEYNLKEIQQTLTRSSGFIKNEIAGVKIMRTIPELTFIYDEFEAKARRLDELFTQIETERDSDQEPGQDDDPETERA